MPRRRISVYVESISFRAFKMHVFYFLISQISKR
jgi:hypothetical protein